MFYIFIIVLIIADQVSKFLIRQNFLPGDTTPVVDGIFHITYVQNTGASFGIFSAHTSILTYITGIMILALLAYSLYLKNSLKKGKLTMAKLQEKITFFAFALIIAGGAGNAIDRFARGFVTDMFDFRVWPVFNVADIYICIGCALIIFSMLKWENKK